MKLSVNRFANSTPIDCCTKYLIPTDKEALPFSWIHYCVSIHWGS